MTNMKVVEKQATALLELVQNGQAGENDFPGLVQHGMPQEVVDYYFKFKDKLKAGLKMTKNDVTQLIDKLTNAVSFKFKEDATSPNVTISKLKNGTYYCSVVRYAKSGGAQKKVVVCKAESSSLQDALTNVIGGFLKVAAPQPDPLQELDKLVNG